MTMHRRPVLLALPLLLANCSVLPDRPYREVRRFALAPERPSPQAPMPGRPALLLRSMRAAPGLDQRGLRSLGSDGQVRQDFWAEWAAPPAELVEEATRHWLAASGQFAAITAPGSRLRAGLVLEAELLRLQSEPGTQRARATLAGLLLLEAPESAAAPRILGQLQAEGEAPLAPGDDPALAAAAMTLALGRALAGMEARIVAAMPRGT
jgi:ABC-type uncharacterized transport system auxiliary subunit